MLPFAYEINLSHYYLWILIKKYIFIENAIHYF